jgi:hypothetical protein
MTVYVERGYNQQRALWVDNSIKYLLQEDLLNDLRWN